MEKIHSDFLLCIRGQRDWAFFNGDFCDRNTGRSALENLRKTNVNSIIKDEDIIYAIERNDVSTKNWINAVFGTERIMKAINSIDDPKKYCDILEFICIGRIYSSWVFTKERSHEFLDGLYEKLRPHMGRSLFRDKEQLGDVYVYSNCHMASYKTIDWVISKEWGNDMVKIYYVPDVHWDLGKLHIFYSLGLVVGDSMIDKYHSRMKKAKENVKVITDLCFGSNMTFSSVLFEYAMDDLEFN